MSTRIQAKPLFAATLTPHRSLTPRGRRTVISLAVALGLFPGMIFYFAGAWPVAAFMAADVVAIWLTFAVSTRAGKAREVLTLWPGALELTRVDSKGAEDALRFVPADVRFVISRDYNERVTGLWLKEGERRVPLGAFLSADEKLSLSKVFGSALRKARS
ncbi:MAG: DUF2244 domain-containing protein [Devosia sp.]